LAAAALAVSLAGCGSHPASSTAKSGSAGSGANTSSAAPTSAPGHGADYSGWLIKASDINAPEVFTAGPPISSPNGQPGVATTFSTQDGSHVIRDTIQVLADPTAAMNALNAAKGAQSSVLKNPISQPADIGTGGTTLLGDAPDGSKGISFLMFTEGKAFVTLEFDGPVDSLAPPDFVTDVGQRQDAAVKKGLGG